MGRRKPIWTHEAGRETLSKIKPRDQRVDNGLSPRGLALSSLGAGAAASPNSVLACMSLIPSPCVATSIISI